MQYLIGVDLGTTATKAVLLKKMVRLLQVVVKPTLFIVMLAEWQKNHSKKFLKQS